MMDGSKQLEYQDKDATMSMLTLDYNNANQSSAIAEYQATNNGTTLLDNQIVRQLDT